MQRGFAWGAGALAVLLWTTGAEAQVVSQRIGTADTALLFGGSDAEGGIGDWYLSNGVVQAIVDDVGPRADLTAVLSGSVIPPIQSEIAATGGTLIDVGRVGANDDQLPQMFVVGGLSTANFVLSDSITVPAPGTIRASGGLLLPPLSQRPTPCIALVTDFSVAGSDPFVTITSTATNGCAAPVALTGFLDATIWTQRGIVPFSGGGTGFDHTPLDLSNPGPALETPAFLGAPGVLGPDDGVMDPASGTTSGEVSYGLLGVRIEVDADGPGGVPPVTTPVDGLFGVSSNLVSALGNLPLGGTLAPGGTLTYVRRLYVGARNDVRSVADAMIADLAARRGFATGTLGGDVDAADTRDVAASLFVTRLGRCAGDATRTCRAAADCGGSGPCADPVPTPGFAPGSAVSHVRTDGAGVFSGVVLPQGTYAVHVVAPERDDVTVEPIGVGAGETAVAIPPLAARGTLAFDVREKKRKRPRIPAKLVVKGVPPTPDPLFARTLPARLGTERLDTETFGGGQPGSSEDTFAQGNVVYVTTGEGSVQVRPGTYDVYASRGMEYGIATQRITVTAGQQASLAFRLKRVIKTKQALGADFHVHSGRSLDSSAPLAGRLAAFAAEGVEVLVSTDHDKHLDYAALLQPLGLARQLATIPGVEVTGSVPNPPVFPNSIGHINAWPMPVEPDRPRDGAIQDEYTAPNWVFSRLRALGGADVVVQYNHPRAGVSGLTNIGFFNSIGCSRCANAIDTACVQDADCPAGGDRECTCVGYQPERRLDQPPNDLLLDTGILGPGTTPNPGGVRNIDFDVMEVANGAKASDYPALLQVRRDWLSLLQQGVVKPATGVSDSHRLTVEHAGWARTYVLGVGDDPTRLDVPRFNERVRAGAMLVAAGPWIEATVQAGSRRGGFGQTVRSRSGKVRVRLRVLSPAWIPVDEVRLVANGATIRRFDGSSRPRVRPTPGKFASSGNTLRLKASVQLRLAADTFLTVEAGPPLGDEAALPTPPPIVDIVEPGVVPFAMTNPIFVDVAGDGFTPPGLSVALAGGAVPGRMTGITRAAREEAMRRGEHLSWFQLRLPAVATP
jgi:hypothetical protein